MNRLATTVLAAIAALSSGLARPSSTATPEEVAAPKTDGFAERLDAYAAPLVAADQLSGRLVVRLGDDRIITRSWGAADRELGVPVSDTSVFNVASVTKAMTAIALARLVEADTLALEDPIARWLPDFPRAGDITVEMLARHRAGIPHRVTGPEAEAVPRTAADMVELAAGHGLQFEPGTDRSYSSGGYSVLARVMELAAGMSYADILDAHVFGPAGMNRSAHADSRMILPGRTSSYLIAPSGAIVNAPLKDLSFLVGAGSVWSTADDLERLATTLRRGGYGERIRKEMVGESGFRSNGLTSGFRAFVDWHREGDVTVAFTGNMVTGAADLLRRTVPRLAAGEEVSPPDIPDMETVEVPTTTLLRYEGSYTLRPGRDLEVRAHQGGLRIGEWILIPTAVDTFVSPQDYATVRIVIGEDGRPEKMEWTSGDTTSEMPWQGPLED